MTKRGEMELPLQGQGRQPLIKNPGVLPEGVAGRRLADAEAGQGRPGIGARCVDPHQNLFRLSDKLFPLSGKPGTREQPKKRQDKQAEGLC